MSARDVIRTLREKKNITGRDLDDLAREIDRDTDKLLERLEALEQGAGTSPSPRRRGREEGD